MIFYHEVTIGRDLRAEINCFTFFTDGLDTGLFFATACTVYASNLLPCVHCMLATGYLMGIVLYAKNLLPHAQ
jgi:hypothetical protein